MWLADLGFSEHIGGGWRGQLARVLRWHERIRALGADTGGDDSSTVAFDYLYAFFQNCYHLRDWLKNDDAISEDRLQAFMASSQHMRVCRDIANGTKHLRVRAPSIDSKPAIGREYHPAGAGKRAGTSESYFILLDDPRTDTTLRFDLQDLADECIAAWMTLLREEKLI